MQDGRRYSEKECLEQLSYAIGVVKPLNILVADDTTVVSKIEFDFRHGDTVVSLALQETKHQVTVASCHVGRQPEQQLVGCDTVDSA